MEKEIATLAGRCFWCTEAIFKRLKGVISVASGYAGGIIENPKRIRARRKRRIQINNLFIS